MLCLLLKALLALHCKLALYYVQQSGAASQRSISKSRKMLQWLVVVTSYIKVARRYEALRLFVIQSRDRPIRVTQNQSHFTLIMRCDTDITVCMKYI